MHRRKLSVFRIWSVKFTYLKKSFLSSNSKKSSFKTNLRNLSMSIAGVSLSRLTSTRTSWSRRSSLYRSASSLRLRRLLRKMCSSRRRKNSTLSWRTSWRSNLAPKSPKSSLSTSRTWKSAPSNLKTWLVSFASTRPSARQPSLKFSAWITKLRALRKFGSIASVKWKWVLFPSRPWVQKTMAQHSRLICKSKWPSNSKCWTRSNSKWQCNNNSKCLCNSKWLSSNKWLNSSRMLDNLEAPLKAFKWMMMNLFDPVNECITTSPCKSFFYSR